MKSLSEIFSKDQKNKDRDKDQFLKNLARDPRQKMIDEFHRRVNNERVSQDMKPLPFIAIKMKVNHLGNDDMAYLLKKCQQSSNFSKMFFGLLKIKKNEQKVA
jgi:hypothetical protein